MELRDFFKLIFKNRYLVLGAAFLLGAVAYVVSLTLPPRYLATSSLFISRKIEKPLDNSFAYEGYYAAQTADKFTETAFGLIKSKDILSETLKQLGLPVSYRSLKSLSGDLFVRRAAPQLLSLEMKGESGEEASSKMKALISVASLKVSEISQKDKSEISASFLFPLPVVEKVEVYPALNGAVGLFVGLGIAVSFVALRKNYG